ncbi:hypothetical protein F4782DRAFT_247377 [Xylaria castorea]|nr:hypothetical protein F4782DRAFT_247377 [Xylaria castorea]
MLRLDGDAMVRVWQLLNCINVFPPFFFPFLFFEFCVKISKRRIRFLSHLLFYPYLSICVPIYFTTR